MNNKNVLAAAPDHIADARKMVAPAAQGEPVAWIVRHSHFCGKFTDDKEIAAHWESKKQGCTTPLFHCSQPAEQHPDDAAVDRFAAAMKAKLNKKRQEGRGGWQSMTAEQLSALLHEHVRKCDPVDVANLAMMLHQNGQRIEQQPVPDVAGLVEALEAACEYLPIGSWELEMARAALTAHRKQGGKS